jgi:nucleoside-diphosphate-sugar epimerase
MRVLVIGGTGFIGPSVVRSLSEQGHDVSLFHRGKTRADLPEGVRHYFGERADLPAYREEFAHAAPEVALDMRPLIEVEARAAVEALRGIARRLVAISSQDVYRAYGRLIGTEPGPPDATPLTEDSPLREKQYPYRGETPRPDDDPRRWADDYDKILVERIVLGEPSLPGTVLRLPMVYGPRDGQHRLFEYLKRMDDSRSAILLGAGAARWRSNHGYVDNVADAIALAVTDDRAAGHVYNVGEEDSLTQTEWIQCIAEQAGWQGSIVTLPPDRLPAHLKPGIDTEHDLAVDTTRLRAELGYQETISRPEALRRTIAWERVNPPELVDPTQFDYDAEDTALRELGY